MFGDFWSLVHFVMIDEVLFSGSTPSFDFPVRLQFGVVILGKEMSSGCSPCFSGVAKKLSSFRGLWLVLFRFISLPQLQVLVSVYVILPL